MSELGTIARLIRGTNKHVWGLTGYGLSSECYETLSGHLLPICLECVSLPISKVKFNEDWLYTLFLILQNLTLDSPIHLYLYTDADARGISRIQPETTMCHVSFFGELRHIFVAFASLLSVCPFLDSSSSPARRSWLAGPPSLCVLWRKRIASAAVRRESRATRHIHSFSSLRLLKCIGVSHRK